VASLASAAAVYGSRGLTVLPLIPDEDGKPKKPAIDHYTHLTAADNSAHYWPAATGLGIVLGRASGNLAVIDVDDSGLAEWLEWQLRARPEPPLMVRTPRPGLHIYVVEAAASKPLDIEATYQQRRCLVQLLAQGCQSGAPPTEGYSWIDAKAEPLYADSILDAWRQLAWDFHLFSREAKPWSFLRRERSRGPTTGQLREAMKDVAP